MDFSFTNIEQGLFLIEKDYSVEKARHGSDISGPYWMLIELEIRSGRIWWKADGRRVDPSANRFYIFLPQFCWALEHYDKNTRVVVRGLISKKEIGATRFSQPTLFYSKRDLPQKAGDISAFLRDGENPINIGACSKPSSLSERTKQKIDRGYDGAIEIQNIAKDLKTTPAVLSRVFKSDFGQPPAFYRKGLRVTVGMHELMMGTPPIQAAQLAGYSDLGRFYKQFKAYLKQTPSEYAIRSKNAKTLRHL